MGSVVPACIAIPSLGYMARQLDAGLFGVALLIWALVGYAGIFDAGLGKAVVRFTAMELDEASARGQILGTALVSVVIAGAVATCILYLLAGFLTHNLFNVQAVFAADSIRGIQIASFCVAPFLVSVILQSYLEGTEQFKSFNYYRSVSGGLTYLLPVAGLVLHYGFTGMIVGLVVARIASMLIISYVVSTQNAPRNWHYSKSTLIKMVRFGGWLTLTNIISPFMVYMDRFIVAKILGARAVAFYTAPAELVSRMSLIPVSITRALFPRLSALNGVEGAAEVQRQATLYMMIVALPTATLLIFAAPLVIGLWLGSAYVLPSTPVLRILLVGFVFNSLALIPYNSLQAKGHSDITAKIHMVEIVPYLLLLIIAILKWGVVGAASIWSLRMIVDCAAMQHYDKRRIAGGIEVVCAIDRGKADHAR